MKRLLVMIPAILVICLFFAVSASAASDEPQAAASFDVNIVVNGDEYAVVSVSASAEGNVYAFDLSELLCALGVDMAYDEDTQTVSLTAKAAPAEEAEKAGPVKPSAWPAGKGDVHALRAVTAEEPGPAVEEDKPAAAKGILCGIVTIPVGVLVGGLVAGFPVGMVLRNLIPIVLIAALIALGLWKAEKAMIKGFAVFGKLIVAVITVGLAAAIVEALTGFAIIPGMAPIEDGFLTVGAIAIVLAGAFPLVFLITKLLKKPLIKFGRLLKINDTAAAGLIASLANSIATFGLVKDMDHRGKVVNVAFAVSAAFVFGDHLGFTAGFAPEMLPAVILGKLAGGISAVAVALLITRRGAKQ